MTTTRTRSRGHTGSRASAARAGAERRPVIIASVAGAVILLAFAALATSIGHVVLAATDHFMLKYSGVFALVLLTGSAVIGVLATDRIILNPGHRVIAQAVHRAFAFGTLAFLVVHIVLEITAQHLEESKTLHVHVLDAFIPFLSQYRTFYMAEGTIASDIIILLVITGILRRRFTTNGNAWKWRAIHYSNYAALILGVLHGLLAGRKAIGTFVYWSYGVVILLLALAVVVRFLATSLRNKEVVAGAAPLAEKGGTVSSRSMPVRAAALGLMSQVNGAMPLGGATRAVPALQGGNPAVRAPYSAPYPAAPYPAAPYPGAAGVPQAIAAPLDPLGQGRVAGCRVMSRAMTGHPGTRVPRRPGPAITLAGGVSPVAEPVPSRLTAPALSPRTGQVPSPCTIPALSPRTGQARSPSPAPCRALAAGPGRSPPTRRDRRPRGRARSPCTIPAPGPAGMAVTARAVPTTRALGTGALTSLTSQVPTTGAAGATEPIPATRTTATDQTPATAQVRDGRAAATVVRRRATRPGTPGHSPAAVGTPSHQPCPPVNVRAPFPGFLSTAVTSDDDLQFGDAAGTRGRPGRPGHHADRGGPDDRRARPVSAAGS